MKWVCTQFYDHKFDRYRWTTKVIVDGVGMVSISLQQVLLIFLF